MKSKQQCIEEFSAFIPFAESLGELEDTVWNAPIEEGKWAVRDILCHIMLWDKYFLEHCLDKIEQGLPLTHGHADYDEFNRQAIQYAQGRGQQEMVQEAVLYRQKVLDSLTRIPEEEYNTVHHSGAYPFTVYEYAADWFIPHDEHHVRQIRSYLDVRVS
jgi:uncharacterized damage-inducible protein DinB